MKRNALTLARCALTVFGAVLTVYVSAHEGVTVSARGLTDGSIPAPIAILRVFCAGYAATGTFVTTAVLASIIRGYEQGCRRD